MEDSAQIKTRADFERVKLFTIAEGEITSMHIAMKGFTAETYITDMQVKVKRGQQGVVERGKIAAGIADTRC